MITRDELLERLNALVAQRAIKNVDIARVLDLPDSRIPALLRGERRIYLDEATRLVEAFGLEPDPLEPVARISVLRLAALHVARKAGASLQEEQLASVAADLKAYLRFVGSRKGRFLVEAGEAYLEALSPRPQEEARLESDQTH